MPYLHFKEVSKQPYNKRINIQYYHFYYSTKKTQRFQFGPSYNSIDSCPLQNETASEVYVRDFDSIIVGYTSAITIVHLEIQNNYKL